MYCALVHEGSLERLLHIEEEAIDRRRNAMHARRHFEIEERYVAGYMSLARMKKEDDAGKRKEGGRIRVGVELKSMLIISFVSPYLAISQLAPQAGYRLPPLGLDCRAILFNSRANSVARSATPRNTIRDSFRGWGTKVT